MNMRQDGIQNYAPMTINFSAANSTIFSLSSSTTLDQIEIGVNIVGTIDCNVELRMLIQRNERDTEGLSLFLSSNRVCICSSDAPYGYIPAARAR
eukprot:CCRYP_020856-RB/>CCRYP_020856-RB protein AED:0.46 eAED:0.46 QI:0/0.5/0.33/1/0/0/3/0/94